MLLIHVTRSAILRSGCGTLIARHQLPLQRFASSTKHGDNVNGEIGLENEGIVFEGGAPQLHIPVMSEEVIALMEPKNGQVRAVISNITMLFFVPNVPTF